MSLPAFQRNARSLRPVWTFRVIARDVRSFASSTTASGSADSGGPNGSASVGASSGITGSSRRLPSPANTLSVTGSGDGHIIGQ